MSTAEDQESQESPRTARPVAWHLAGVALFSALMLLAHAGLFDPSRLHLADHFVDQVHYITTARHYLETGRFESGLIYPAYVEQAGWRPYMPGSYLPLILSYGALGFGVVPSLLPGWIAYVLASLGVFSVARRLYGISSAWLAVILYDFFPGNLNYAFTALTDMPFAATCILVLAAFLALPEGWRPWSAPLLLGVAFLYRETGALLVFPVTVLLVGVPGPRGWLRPLVVATACVFFLYGLNRWQLASGKGEAPLSWPLQGGFNYGDAFAPPAPELGVGEWLQLFLENARRNFGVHAKHLSTDWTHIQVLGWLTIAGSVLVLTVVGLLRWRRDRFPLGVGLMGLSAFALLYLLYDVNNQKAMRSTLFLFPFCAVALAGCAYRSRWAEAAREGRAVARGSLALLAVAFLGASLFGSTRAGHALVKNTHRYDEAPGHLARLGHDESKLLIGPLETILRYAVLQHPSGRAALPPTNAETLELLLQRFEVGTLILPRGGERALPRGFLGQHGLSRVGEFAFERHPQRVYHVYRKP